MNFKVFAAFFVTLLAVNVSQQSPLKDDSIKEIVVVVLNKVLAVTEKLLTKVNADLEDFEANEADVKTKILDLAIKEAKVVSKSIFELIDELNKDATDDGKSVLTCIEAEQDKTDKAIEVTASDIADCIATEVDVVLPEVKTIVGELGDLQADVKGQVDTLSSCSDDELVCLIAFLQSAEKTVEKIVTVLKSDVTVIVALAKTVIKDLLSCDIKTHLNDSIQDIFNDAVVCIKA